MSVKGDRPLIRGLAHVCYTVADLDRSLAFYCGTLGLTPAFEFIRPTGEKYGQYIHAGGRNFIEIFVGELAERAEKPALPPPLLEVDDMEYTIASWPPRRRVPASSSAHDRSHQAWITDPTATASSCTATRREQAERWWLSRYRM